jgi:tetratricopeptide (TPR) repeat protein
MSRLSLLTILAAASLLAVPGCKKKDGGPGGGGTTTPGDETAQSGQKPGPRTDASGDPIPQLPPGQSEAPKMQEEQGKKSNTPLPQDRDPEEEKRKMAQSREISARGKSALRSGDLTRAIEESRQALRVHEQNVEAMLVIAESFFKQGKWEITQGVATSILAVDPRRLSPNEASQAYNLRGFAYLAQGKREQARTMFRSAAEMDAKNATAWNNLGVQYMMDGDWSTAATCFKYATEVSPTFTKAQQNYGTALRGQGKLVEAEAQFNKMVQQRPSYAEAYYNLGVLYLDADPFPNLDTTARYNKAIQQFTKYKELAISQGHKDPEAKNLTAIETAMVSSRKLVSTQQADLYIEMARKAIDREAKRVERDQRRKEKEAKKKAKDAEKAAKAAEGGGDDGGGDADGGEAPKAEDPPKTQKPGGASGA